MKRIRYIILILLISCASTAPIKKPDVVKTKPSLISGCDKYKGIERSECIGMMLRDYQNLRNSSLVETKVDEYRKDEKYVIQVFEPCREYKGKKLLCDGLIEREVYQPTFRYFVVDLVVKGGIGAIIGFLTRGL